MIYQTKQCKCEKTNLQHCCLKGTQSTVNLPLIAKIWWLKSFMLILILSLIDLIYPLRLWIISKASTLNTFMTCVICRRFYSTLGIYSLDAWRCVQPPRSCCNFGPQGTDVIGVPCIAQDVPLHKRFPCWCRPVISFSRPWYNVTMQCPTQHAPAGKPNNVPRLHPPTQPNCNVLQHGKLFSLVMRRIKEGKKALCAPEQVLFKYFTCKEILHRNTFTWLQRRHKKTKQGPSKNSWLERSLLTISE